MENSPKHAHRFPLEGLGGGGAGGGGKSSRRKGSQDSTHSHLSGRCSEHQPLGAWERLPRRCSRPSGPAGSASTSSASAPPQVGWTHSCGVRGCGAPTVLCCCMYRTEHLWTWDPRGRGQGGGCSKNQGPADTEGPALNSASTLPARELQGGGGLTLGKKVL